MKRTLTRMISAVCAAALGIGCMAIGADAKVIEPEVVKTESWTTSYYIDDDMDTLYPYIQCEADIYNDGTIKLYMWNTHEWDGFVTVRHTISIVQSGLDSREYGTPNYSRVALPISDTESAPFSKQYGEYTLPDSSYMPQPYRCLGAGSINISGCMFSISVSNMISDYSYYSDSLNETFTFEHEWEYPHMTGTIELPRLKTEKPKDPVYVIQPTEDPTDTYNFRLFGHDITITPELLSGSIIAEPKQTEQEQKIKALEEENAALKASLAAIDSDSDDLLTSADAQAILNYYVAYLAGKVSGKVSDYAEYSKQKG